MQYFGWALGLLPLLWLRTDGPNPVTDALHLSGLWALGFMLGSLGVRPLVQIARWRRLQSWKKILGLLGFIYGSIHSLIYIALDQGF